ncbi:MFS transporter, partial [Kibdelosporangium lantanae]
MTHRWTAALAWCAVLLEGYDLVVLGTVIPVLLDGKVWGMTPASASVVTTVGLVGMMIGAMAAGAVT